MTTYTAEQARAMVAAATGPDDWAGIKVKVKAIGALERSAPDLATQLADTLDEVARLRARDELIAYVLQDDLMNRLVPRVVDIAYNAFMSAKRPNNEDGGPSDWFTDTKPMVDAKIAAIRAALNPATATEGE